MYRPPYSSYAPPRGYQAPSPSPYAGLFSRGREFAEAHETQLDIMAQAAEAERKGEKFSSPKSALLEKGAEVGVNTWNHQKLKKVVWVLAAITVIILVALIGTAIANGPNAAKVGLGVTFGLMFVITSGFAIYVSTIPPNLGDYLGSDKLSNLLHHADATALKYML